ncbi:MAG: hypothetical protein O7G88_04540 [bacterium]|nr:hypothetical protein [bacterium]
MRMRAITLRMLIAVLILIPLRKEHALAGNVPSIAIMNFTNQTLDDPAWQWLSKGLADLLVTDLARAKKFQVVDRHKIQDYLDEINLSGAGIVAPKTAIKIGKMARVEKVLLGNFRVEAKQIEIQTYIIDIKTQQVEQVERIKGLVDDILDLEKTLALKIIDNLNISLTQAEIDSIKFKSTDSLDAASRFYRGLDAYDNGRYFDALRAFCLAEKQDPQYDKPLLFQGHVYENQGEYEHAILSFKRLAERALKSEFADDGLFFAGKLTFEHFGRAKEALQLADQIINRYPNGLLPDNTQIMPAVRTHEAVIAIQSHHLPLKSYMHLFKYYIYLRTNRYQAALKALEAAESGIPTHRLHTYRTYYEWRKNRLVRDAYTRTGTVLFPKLPHVIGLSPELSIYEEDYSTAKRLKESYVLGTEYFEWGGKKLSTSGRDKQTGEFYINNPYLKEKDEWFSVTDEYVFAAPEGYIVTSVELDYEGFQTRPGTINIAAGSLGDNYPYGSSTQHTNGKFRAKDRIAMLPGTRMFKVQVAIWGDFAKKVNQRAHIYKWMLKANLVKARKAGTLQILSNADLVVFLDPPVGAVSHARAINWKIPHRQCPCTFFNVPQGRHRVVAFAAGQHRSVFKDGRRQELMVTVKHGVVRKAEINFSPRKNNDVAAALPGWRYHVLVSKRVQRIGPGGQVFNLQLLQDGENNFWLLWYENFDLWLSQSPDGLKWTVPKPLRAPVNTSSKEGNMSVIQGEDGRFYMAFMSERGTGKGLYISHSKDMEHWSKPRRTATPKHVYGRTSLLQLEDGTFRIYYANKGYEMSFVSSPGLRNWSEAVSVQLPEQNFYQVIQDRSGRFWLVLGGYKKHERPVFILSSADGIKWGESTLVEPSLTNHNLASSYPVLLENHLAELVLAWQRTTRIAFSKSKHGHKWSPSGAAITSNSSASYPNAPVSLIQRHDKQYMLAYVNGEGELWVSLSKDPFR